MFINISRDVDFSAFTWWFTAFQILRFWLVCMNKTIIILPKLIILIKLMLSTLNILIWKCCSCRACWYFLWCESAENSLSILLHFLFRLYSKVTRQNAIPDYCRSPLPISAGHSMLPDITGLKLQAIHPLCSEYPFPTPWVFIWSLVVAPCCSSPLHPQILYLHKSLKVSKRSDGETEQRDFPVCKRDGEKQDLGSSWFPVLKPLQKELSKTSGFSLVLGSKGFTFLLRG